MEFQQRKTYIACYYTLVHRYYRIYGKIGEPMYYDYVVILLYMLNLRRKLFCHMDNAVYFRLSIE
jgi:hypothetical protein